MKRALEIADISASKSSADRTAAGRFTALPADKLRGGYYTSSKVAAWLASWAIRTANDRVLEPSCGDGVFLEAAVRRFGELGLSDPSVASSIVGVENSRRRGCGSSFAGPPDCRQPGQGHGENWRFLRLVAGN